MAKSVVSKVEKCAKVDSGLGLVCGIIICSGNSQIWVEVYHLTYSFYPILLLKTVDQIHVPNTLPDLTAIASILILENYLITNF